MPSLLQPFPRGVVYRPGPASRRRAAARPRRPGPAGSATRRRWPPLVRVGAARRPGRHPRSSAPSRAAARLVVDRHYPQVTPSRSISRGVLKIRVARPRRVRSPWSRRHPRSSASFLVAARLYGRAPSSWTAGCEAIRCSKQEGGRGRGGQQGPRGGYPPPGGGPNPGSETRPPAREGGGGAGSRPGLDSAARYRAANSLKGPCWGTSFPRAL